ncbi:hypothetical protein [Shinella zoogloeoides]|uniref:hypothetical protein n=1 Tax=Shinella zoogloeoides TaxID=352475 RepID=UPI001F576708|nr:hypothetical protein [Shinella zoogloeoides]
MEFHHFPAQAASNGWNFRGLTMTCTADRAIADATHPRKKSFWQRVARLLRRRKRRPHFDPRHVSDHIKRDLGYLDGRH